MAELKAPGSARQRTTSYVIIGLLVVLIVGVAALFLSPNSPLRPKAAEITGGVAVGTPQTQAFRDGTVSKIADNKVTVDEPNGGSFSFPLADIVVVRGLNKNGRFEIVDHGQLHVGDIVSVFYQQSDVVRVDIIKAK